MRVSEVSGSPLDCLVAIAFGLPAEEVRLGKGGIHCEVFISNRQRGENMGILMDTWMKGDFLYYKPTQWWSHAGPIIDMADISIEQSGDRGNGDRRKYAYVPGKELEGQFGDTTLEAVSRCFVVDRLGEEIPDEWLPKETKVSNG